MFEVNGAHAWSLGLAPEIYSRSKPAAAIHHGGEVVNLPAKSQNLRIAEPLLDRPNTEIPNERIRTFIEVRQIIHEND